MQLIVLVACAPLLLPTRMLQVRSNAIFYPEPSASTDIPHSMRCAPGLQRPLATRAELEARLVGKSKCSDIQWIEEAGDLGKYCMGQFTGE